MTQADQARKCPGECKKVGPKSFYIANAVLDARERECNNVKKIGRGPVPPGARARTRISILTARACVSARVREREKVFTFLHRKFMY